MAEYFEYNLLIICDSSSLFTQDMNVTGQFMLGGLVERDVTLRRTAVPYQVNADLTVMPGVTLSIEPGVEMEFYPNVGLLVLGHLKASGLAAAPIRMTPVRKHSNRVQYFSDSDNDYARSDKAKGGDHDSSGDG
jgi:hypothetical protein